MLQACPSKAWLALFCLHLTSQTCPLDKAGMLEARLACDLTAFGVSNHALLPSSPTPISHILLMLDRQDTTPNFFISLWQWFGLLGQHPMAFGFNTGSSFLALRAGILSCLTLALASILHTGWERIPKALRHTALPLNQAFRTYTTSKNFPFTLLPR